MASTLLKQSGGSALGKIEVHLVTLNSATGVALSNKMRRPIACIGAVFAEDIGGTTAIVIEVVISGSTVTVYASNTLATTAWITIVGT